MTSRKRIVGVRSVSENVAQNVDRSFIEEMHMEEELKGKMNENNSLEGDYLNIALLLLLYTLQGVPMGLSRSLDLILQEKSISFEQQGIFGMVSFPYSIKLLWAPLVDSVYRESVGRRKSWLLPTQFIIGFLLLYCSYTIEELLGETTGDEPQVKMLTAVFFTFYFLCATQDIAVDGWAVTMLKRENVGYASTCNAVGQTFGYFISFTGFLGMKMYNIMDLAQFMSFWGYIFILTTVILWLFKKEETCRVDTFNAEEQRELSVRETYGQMFKIVMLPAVRLLAVILITRTIAFAAAENLAQRKLVQKGMKKEQVASLMVFITPVSIILPGLLSKYTSKKPLSLFKTLLKAYLPRIGLAFVANFVVYFAPNFDENGESLPFGFYIVLLAYVLIGTMVMTVMFVCQMAFYAKIADPKIGGTYMTLLNTISNFGSHLPNQAVLFLVNRFTFESCEMSENLAENCKVYIDGFYVINTLCVLSGFFWYRYFSPKLDMLQNLKPAQWHISKPL